MSKVVLVVDDERNIRRMFDMVLASAGYTVATADTGETALDWLADNRADVVLLDISMPGIDGLETLRRIRAANPEQTVVMVSGHGTIESAVEATREGARDFLEKPVGKERLLVALENALHVGSLDRECRRLQAQVDRQRMMVGESEPMKQLREEIARVAPTPARVLITGESGTGKELIARAIHAGSDRSGEAFVKVNCAAIPEELIESELFGAVKGSYTGATESRDGKFMQADGGTIFLDEVGDMSLRAQAKVLRALQEGEIEKVGGSGAISVDVRVLAATNRDLQAAVGEGAFREDLFFRLAVVPLAAPPLRERRDDVPLLAEHFLARYCLDNNLPPREFTPDALALLEQLPWSGNVRELINAVERLAIMTPGRGIGPEDLRRGGLLGAAPDPTVADDPTETTSPAEVARLGGLVAARQHYEAACIREGLRAAGGNVSQAARLLGIDRTNLHKKIQSYGLTHEKGESR